jgi:hypothetical protein
VIAGYAGPDELVSALEQNRARALSLATADFDADGVPDLVSGYAGPYGGIITIHRGNVDSIYPNRPEAKQNKAEGRFAGPSFLSPAGVYAVAEAADFVGAGDFDADTRLDIVAAARGGHKLYLMAGDGRGGFAEVREIALPGRVTAMQVGEVNRRDGLEDIVVCVATPDGARALVYEGPEGALRAGCEVFTLAVEASDVEIAEVNGDGKNDVIIATGRELMFVGSRDRKLSLDIAERASVKPARVEKQGFTFRIKSVEAGDFTGDQQADLALLSEEGAVFILDRGNEKNTKRTGRWHQQRVGGDGIKIIKANVSSVPSDDLLVFGSKGMGLITRNTSKKPSVKEALDLAFVSETAPVSALGMRLNGDALDDLVVLRAGSSAPSVLLSVPSAILTVNSSADTNARDNVLTLREAILLANGDPVLPLASLTAAEQGQIQGVPAPGLDEIRFNIPSGSLSSENETVSKARARLSEAAQAEGSASQSVDSRVTFLPTFADKVSGAFNLSPAVFPCDTRPFPEVLTPVGNSPYSTTIGDFNEDGLPDLAVANAGSNSVSVLLGAGAGSYNPATDYQVGVNPRAIAAADFNNDGNLDLAVVNSNTDFAPGSISILLGTGAGDFGSQTQFPGRIFPAALAVGFFNEDGLLDIAVANNRSNSVSIYIGKVTGGFADAVDFPITGAPNSIAVADFNGDSELDLAVSNPDNVAVLIGTGTGSFGAATNFAVGTRPVSVAVADFNGDNKLDIVTANQSNVTVLRGTGTGNFNIRLDFQLGAAIGSIASSNSLAVGEFTGDNNLDVVVITGSHTSFILMTGSSNGILTASTINLTFGSNPVSVTAGD